MFRITLWENASSQILVASTCSKFTQTDVVLICNEETESQMNCYSVQDKVGWESAPRRPKALKYLGKVFVDVARK